MLAQAPPNANAPTIVPRPAGAQIKVPAGFSVEEFAAGLVGDGRDRSRRGGRGRDGEEGEAEGEGTNHGSTIVGLERGSVRRVVSG